MVDDVRRIRVSVVMLFREQSPASPAAFVDSVRAALSQDHPAVDLVVVDDRGAGASLDVLPADLRAHPAFTHVAGHYRSRAAMFNAAIDVASGDYILLLANDDTVVTLRRSAVWTWLMAAVRHPRAGMIYADYELIEASGQRTERHLLDWHEGRLRDIADFGKAWLLPARWLRQAKLNERYETADLYDLRLRASEQGPLVHIANHYAGSLYSVAVATPTPAHDTYAYLLTDRASQIEMEEAVTGHLRRIGALLDPDAHYRAPACSSGGEERSSEYIASIVIPVNNRPEFIGRAIESAQQQTVRNFEIVVVVNGGPDDPTASVVRRYMEGGDRYRGDAPPVRLIVVDVNGLGFSLNAGLSSARGKYYIQLDSDDRLKPDAVEKIIAVYESDPRIGMVIGSCEVWHLDVATGSVTLSDRVPVVKHEEWTATNGRNNLLRIDGPGAPRSAHIGVIADCGWFGVNDSEQNRNYGEDYDLVLRISERYRIGRVWDPIYEITRHPGCTDYCIDQATIDRNDNAKDAIRRAALVRRRRLNAGADATDTQ